MAAHYGRSASDIPLKRLSAAECFPEISRVTTENRYEATYMRPNGAILAPLEQWG